ncbi:MAG: aminopeptidase [Defluviitaleaceae bacterium]|nr:aminopeptidase [Defluviitaleaceae bacterium]
MERRIRAYAELIVRKGVNVQSGQRVVITADTETAAFVRLLADAAYNAGAAHVHVHWADEAVSKMMYLRADHEALRRVDPWRVEYYRYYDGINACYIFIDSDDPELLSEVEPERIKDASKSTGTAFKAHDEMISANRVRWTVAGVPSRAWAAKVFPDLAEEEAVGALWAKILGASRVDVDPVAAWQEHDRMFKERLNFLNGSAFAALRFTNALGTDLRLELPRGHYWEGGSNTAADGKHFFPNIPTEEVYTLPHCRSAKGRVVASMPLTYNGVTIEDFELAFEAGRVVSHKAGRNAKVLEGILELDEGARMLGEVALVPHLSPISRMNTRFHSTLFDENASCHLALGKAYPMIHGYDGLSPEQAEACGINDSITHVDFMFGTADLCATGFTADGREVPIFINGNWAI